MEKNAAENNEFNKLIKKKLSWGKDSQKRRSRNTLKKLPFSKEKTNVLKTRLKTNQVLQKCLSWEINVETNGKK